jgi:hypothetical protein
VATVRVIAAVWVSVPLVPVTVTVAVPAVAVADAVSVSTLLVPVVVVVAGLKLAVTPVGKPLAVNVTAPAKLLSRVMVSVLVPLAPWFTVRLVGLAASEKSGVAALATVRVIAAVWVSVPLVPVTVTVNMPTVAVLDAVSVSTLLVPVVVVVAGLKLAVTPVGRPLAVNVTAPAKLLRRVIVSVLVPLAPWFTVRLVGLAASEKSAATDTTVRATAAVWVSVPLVPVMVTVAAPAVAVVDAVSVSTLLVPVVVVVAGLKLAVTPVGRPLAVNVTAPANPLTRVMVIVLVPLAPWLILKVAGLAASEKFAAGCVVAVTWAALAVPAASTACTTKKYAVAAVRPVFWKDAAVRALATW